MNISVIVPVYNTMPFLPACLESIWRAALVGVKNGVALHVLCVDDGSTDGSSVFLDHFAIDHVAEGISIEIVHKPNGGEGSARNAGMNRATGEWLMFFDGDDVVAEHVFEDVARAFELFPNSDLIRFATSTFDDGQQPVWYGSGTIESKEVGASLPGEVCMYGVTEMAYLRSMYGRLRFGDYRIGADLVFTSQCFGLSRNLTSVDRANYGYRVRANSMAHCVMTPLKMRNQIAFLGDMLRNFALSGKTIPLTIIRGRGNMLIEGCATELLSHPEDEWRDLWDYWLHALKLYGKTGLACGWQRFVITVVANTRSRVLVQLLCRIPHVLKKKGFHR